jgi:predicted deacylase
LKQLYHSYDQTVKIFEDLKKKRPDVFDLEVIGQTWEKRDIIAVTIAKDISKAHTKPALFYTGTIHAREWIGVELAIAFAKYVDENLEYDLLVRDILEKSTIYLVPCANPDGFEYSREHYSFWRKNRRVNADGSFGVDLNRNFPIGFKKSKDPSSNVYGGPEPFSEPETRALRDFVNSHPNIAIALDYHSQGNVFFPAHNFKHEDTIDTTDMNVLCANMAEEIRKVSNREYGIHQGKPPASLIKGSGREYYYSLGILASVVEVGTRNISDYLDDMSEHIAEQIPALLAAAKEVPNYARDSKMPRIENFRATSVGNNSVTLEWEEYPKQRVYFEIYRSKKEKSYCRAFNLIGLSKANSFIDTHLESDQAYFYHIRAVDKDTKQKSPFAPVLAIRTHVDEDEFHRTYFPNPNKTGYLSSLKTPKENLSHFGENSLFVGVNQTKGICTSVISIPLRTIPKNALIKRAKLRLYPLNRVGVTIEKYGEWSVCILDKSTIKELSSFEELERAKALTYVGRAIPSNHLSQGIWREWEFSEKECEVLQTQIQDQEVIFRVEGPKTLPIGRDSQLMQWDLGYGKFGSGLSFRPHLEITYTLKPEKVTLYPKATYTIKKDQTNEGVIECGFDEKGKKIFASFDFDISSLPDWRYMAITKAYIILNPIEIQTKSNIRLHLEMIKQNTKRDYEGIKNREIIENIGYDVSASDLKNKEQIFVFDSFAIQEVGKSLSKKEKVSFLLRPSKPQKLVKNSILKWHSLNPKYTPKLVIEYLNKRREDVGSVKNLKYTIEKDKDKKKIKLSWENPKHKDFRGVIVIKNPFRKPISPYDGDKLYGGKDNYTYDSFGALDVDKYYAVFTYDDVPNFSKPAIIKYKANSK